ncbi:MAG: dihydroorotate dehydrogenase [Candidatus Thorarchaeota archaeon]
MKIEGYWLASGVLGVTGAIMARVAREGADIIVTKSVGLEPRKGYPGPNITASHSGLLNAVGLTNPGIDSFLDELRILKRHDVPFVISIFGRTESEITQVAKKAFEAEPSALELNLSCPHAEISQIGHSPKLTRSFVKAVKGAVPLPVFAKLTPNASDVVTVGKAAEEAGADAIVAINTVQGMRIDIEQKAPVLANKVGGFSGPPIFPVAVRCVYDLYSALSIPIIGVGGVSTWEDAVEIHLAGASAIQIGTATLGGLDIFTRIREGVEEYLAREGFTDISDIVGLAGRT